MKSSLFFDLGYLDEQVAGGKTSPIVKIANSSYSFAKNILQDEGYADIADDGNGNVLKTKK